VSNVKLQTSWSSYWWIFGDKLEQDRTGRFWKQEAPTEDTGSADRIHVHTEEKRDRCYELAGTKPGRPATNISFNTPNISRETGLTQFSVIRIIHCDRPSRSELSEVSEKSPCARTDCSCCYFCYINASTASKGSVVTQLRCGGRIFNNNVIANF